MRLLHSLIEKVLSSPIQRARSSKHPKRTGKSSAGPVGGFTITGNVEKKAEAVIKVAGVLSFLLGIFYLSLPHIPKVEISFWGLLAIIGGIAAFLASWFIGKAKIFQYTAFFGFLLLGMGQILPIGLWFDSLARINYPFYGRYGALSLLILILHFIIFALSMLIVAKIAFSQVKLKRSYEVES
jgi:hypothetical protein